MIPSVSRSAVSRLLSVATVLTLVGVAASADLQPASALAAPAERASLAISGSYLEDDNENRDNNENRDDNRNNDDKDRNDENHKNNDNNGNNGGEGLFTLICSVPGFANNVGCATGLLGN